MDWGSFLRSSLGRLACQRYRVVGVELDGETVRAAQTAHRQGRTVVEKLVEWTLPHGTISERARALQAGWIQKGLATEDIVLGFPHLQAIVKTMTLPAVDTQQIDAIVRLQAARQTPLPSDNVALAWQRVEGSPAGYSRVMMAIAPRDDVDRTLAVFEEAGLKPDRFVLDAWMVLPWIRAGLEEDRRPLVLAIRGSSAVFGLFEGSSLGLTRCVALPKGQRTTPACWPETLRLELQRTTLGQTAVSPAAGPQVVGLSGEEKDLAASEEALRKVPGCLIKTLRPWRRLTFQDERLYSVAGAYASVLAASLRPFFSDPPSLNLLSPEDLAARTRRRRLQERMGTLVFAVLFGLLLSAALGQRFSARRAELETLTRRIATPSPQIRELRRMERRINAAKGKMDAGGSLVLVLAELRHIVPSGISLQALDFERGRSVLIQGTCLSLADALRLVETLQRSPIFSSVELRSSEAQRVQNQDVVGFTLSGRLVSEPLRQTGRGDHARS